ncbi:IS3 family transposase [Streptomyces sp. NPDC058612]|uniref:IS3 family transposase n=1 Tax=Streptomyces sp. NPDC058612 TaxID=3346555 RepID=UPI00364E1957
MFSGYAGCSRSFARATTGGSPAPRRARSVGPRTRPWSPRSARSTPNTARTTAPCASTPNCGASRLRGFEASGLRGFGASGLRGFGHTVNRKRVARLMRENGIVGRHLRRKKRTTVPDRLAPPAPDLLQRDSTARHLDEKWCGDITYVQVGASWLYVASVIDICSRRVDGRPGDFIGDRPVSSVIQPAGRPTTHLSDQGCCCD